MLLTCAEEEMEPIAVDDSDEEGGGEEEEKEEDKPSTGRATKEEAQVSLSRHISSLLHK